MRPAWLNSIVRGGKYGKLLRDTLTTTGWGVIGKTAGFLIPFFVAAWFGVDAGTDAFFFVYGIILFLAGIFAPVFENVIVPYVAQGRRDGEDIGVFVGGIICLSGIALVLIIFFLLAGIRPLLALATRFDPQTIEAVFRLLVLSSPLVVLMVWTGILGGALNSYKKFALPALSPAFRALVNLGFIYLFKDRLGVYAIALGYLAGELARLLILTAVLHRLRLFRIRLTARFNRVINEFLRTASCQTLGMAVIWANPLVDRAMASWLGEGSISVLYYSDRLFMIPVSLIFVGLFPVVLSHWSSDYYERGRRGGLLREVTGTALAVTGICLIPVAILAFAAGPLVRLAFVRGELDPSFAGPIRTAFLCYLPGLLPYVAGSIFTRGHLVLKNTALIMKVCLVNFCLNVALNAVLMRSLGVAGIALSTTITVSVVMVALYLALRGRLRAFPAGPGEAG